MPKPIFPMYLMAGMTVVLAGCGINTIRLDRATAMGKAGTAATDGTRAVMDQVRQTNREVLIDLAAIDPACILPDPSIPRGRVTDGSQLCRAGRPQPRDWTIKRWTAREFQPTLAVIDGISAYLGAVDAILTRKPVDLVAEVTAAETKLRSITDSLNVIAGSPQLPVLSEEQSAAINGTLKLLSEIVDESGRVEDLRAMERKLDGAEFERNLQDLQAANNQLVASLGSQLSHQRTLVGYQLTRMRKEPAAVRRPLVARQLDLIDAHAALPELQNRLNLTVNAFRKAHSDYRDLLFGNGRLMTKAEKRKAAAVTQARVIGALENLASLIKAF